MLSPEGEEQEFDFYLKFAKPLVLNLPDTNDRIKAATWIKYLKNDETADATLRGNYLKLLLFVLQRRKLFGPFATIPDESKPLEEFPEDINLQDVAKNFVEIDKNILKLTLEKGGFGEWPPYTVACSTDLSEYACCQEIPNFGIHAYYAISKEPLNVWHNYDKAIFPMGESIDTSNPKFSVVDSASPDISCFVSPHHVEAAPPSTPRASPRIPAGGFKTNTKELSDVLPSSLKNKNDIPIVDDFQMDPRIPPNWGSNLVNVKESPQISSRKKKETEAEVTEKDLMDFFNEDTDGEIHSSQASSSKASSIVPSTPPAFTSTPYLPPPSPPPPPSPQRYNNTECQNCGAMKKPTRPSPKSSPNRRQLPAHQLVDAMEYLADDKDMYDYYNDQMQNMSPSHSKTPSMSPKHSKSPPMSPAHSKSRGQDQSANSSYKSDVSISSCCKKMEATEDVAQAVQEILDEMHQPSTGFLQKAGDLIQKTILSRPPESPMMQQGSHLNADIFHTPAPFSPRKQQQYDRTPSPQYSSTNVKEPVWASRADFLKYKKGAIPPPPCPFEVRKPPKVNICDDKEGPSWTTSKQYNKYKQKCTSDNKEMTNISEENYEVMGEYDSISQDLGSDFIVERTNFVGPQYISDAESDVFDVISSISKYIEDDLRVHQAKIPATTPQRSQSPKRLHAGLEVVRPVSRKVPNDKVVWNCNINTLGSSKNSNNSCFQTIMNVYNRMYKLTL